MRVARRRRRLSGPARDLAFVLVLTLVLSAGVLGVLLLNTSMQQQSSLLARQQARAAALSDDIARLRLQLDELSNPALLARLAHRLRLQPAGSVRWVDAPKGAVSARKRAASRARAG